MSSKSKRLFFFFYLLCHICAGLSFGLANPSVCGFQRKWGRRESWKAWKHIAMEEEEVLELQGGCAHGRQGWWDGRSSGCRSRAVEESPAGGREPDAASSPLQHLKLPVCPCFSYCFFCSGFPPLLLLVAWGGGAWQSRGSLPDGSREGARFPGGSWGALHHSRSAWGLTWPCIKDKCCVFQNL